MYLCLYCGLQFIPPHFPDLRAYYRDRYRLSHDSLIGKHMTPAERYGVQHKLAAIPARDFMKEVPEGASVLEIGCSAGGFLGRLQGKYDLYGCEWNPEDAAYVRDVGGIPCEEGDLLEVFPGKSFTAIVALQVLEHQFNPMAFMRAIRERLIGGGWLFLELPNAKDALISMYQIPQYIDFWYRESHLTYWTAEPLAALLSTAGFEARINWRQRYSMHNHVNWLLHKQPMPDPLVAQGVLQPVDRRNPGAGPLNRIWADLEKTYQIQMETLFCADTLRAIGRRQQI